MQKQEEEVLKIHTLTIKYFGSEVVHITSTHNLSARNRYMILSNFRKSREVAIPLEVAQK